MSVDTRDLDITPSLLRHKDMGSFELTPLRDNYLDSNHMRSILSTRDVSSDVLGSMTREDRYGVPIPNRAPLMRNRLRTEMSTGDGIGTVSINPSEHFEGTLQNQIPIQTRSFSSSHSRNGKNAQDFCELNPLSM